MRKHTTPMLPISGGQPSSRSARDGALSGKDGERWNWMIKTNIISRSCQNRVRGL
jgi:hypothetical protein